MGGKYLVQADEAEDAIDTVGDGGQDDSRVGGQGVIAGGDDDGSPRS